MKKTKRFISLLLIIQMMLVCSLIPGVTALDTLETTQIVIENTEELLPMMAARCGPTYGLGGCISVETGEIPDSSGHNQHGPCTYTIYYYGDGSTYGIYTDNRGTHHVQSYSDGTTYRSWWG